MMYTDPGHYIPLDPLMVKDSRAALKKLQKLVNRWPQYYPNMDTLINNMMCAVVADNLGCTEINVAHRGYAAKKDSQRIEIKNTTSTKNIQWSFNELPVGRIDDMVKNPFVGVEWEGPAKVSRAIECHDYARVIKERFDRIPPTSRKSVVLTDNDLMRNGGKLVPIKV